MRNRILCCLLILAFSLPFYAVAQTNGVDEASHSQPPTPSVNSEQPLQRMNIKTFTGKITKHGKDYVLYDMATNLIFKLDNQSQASKYVGKEVSVVGQLVPPENTIHVSKIERAK